MNCNKYIIQRLIIEIVDLVDLSRGPILLDPNSVTTKESKSEILQY